MMNNNAETAGPRSNRRDREGREVCATRASRASARSSHSRLTIAEADFVGPADNTTKPIDAVYAVERSIDRRRDDALAPRTRNRFARGIIDGDKSDAQIDVEGKEHPPSPIGAFMRGAMTETVEMFASKPGARAAPNVPAYFHDARRRESKDAEATEGADKKRRAFVELKNQGDATIGRFEVALLECEHVLTAQDRAAPRFAIAAARAALEGGDPEKLKEAAELLERAATLIEVAASKAECAAAGSEARGSSPWANRADGANVEFQEIRSGKR